MNRSRRSASVYNKNYKEENTIPRISRNRSVSKKRDNQPKLKTKNNLDIVGLSDDQFFLTKKTKKQFKMKYPSILKKKSNFLLKITVPPI